MRDEPPKFQATPPKDDFDTIQISPVQSDRPMGNPPVPPVQHMVSYFLTVASH